MRRGRRRTPDRANGAASTVARVADELPSDDDDGGDGVEDYDVFYYRLGMH
jgi:hypothetical protein